MHTKTRTGSPAAVLALGLLSIVSAHTVAQAPQPSLPVLDERAALERIVRAELAHFPKARPVDVYELIYHAANGAGKAGLDSAKAGEQLRTEWAALKKPKPGERMLDTISPDGKFVRLNLRPWKAAGGARGPLGRAFVESAHDGKPDGSRLEHYWRIVETMGTDNKLPWPVDSVGMLGRRMAGSGFPPAAHSPAFEAAYAPAYRVLTAQRADSLVRSLKPVKPVKPGKAGKAGKAGKPAKHAAQKPG